MYSGITKGQTDVILISFDSFNSEALLDDRAAPPMPYLQQLVDNNLVLENCHCTGYPTQFAAPGLLTSTFPLDYGGYDFGAAKRPTTLAECLDAGGYDTAGFVTGFYLNKLYEYHRGFDRYSELGRADYWTRSLSKNVLDFAHEQFVADNSRKDALVRLVQPIVEEYLCRFEQYCTERREEIRGNDDGIVSLSPNIHGWDYDEAVTTARALNRSYEAAPTEFIERLITVNSDSRHLESLRELERPIRNVGLSRRQRFELAGASLRAWMSTSGPRTDPLKPLNVLEHELTGLLFREPLSRSTSAKYVLDSALSWMRKREEPSFVFAHLFDLHEHNMFTWEPGVAPLDHELSTTTAHLNRIRDRGDAYDGAMSYDLSAKYVDSVLEYFIGQLHERCDEPPLVVITGDHGIQVPGVSPPRDVDKLRSFRDELLHIPAVFVHPSFEGQVDRGLYSAIDISATVLDMLNLPVPESFEGVPVSSLPGTGRESILAEGIGRGPCDATFKPVNVCVRSSERKVVCTADLTGSGEVSVDWAFNLATDPSEIRPLEELDSECETLLDTAERRIDELSVSDLSVIDSATENTFIYRASDRR